MFRPIFVFGSNLAGRHGAGAARFAREHCGAVYGQGIGLQGRSYAIPTLNGDLGKMSVSEIGWHVAIFLAFARDNPSMSFFVTAVGCGLAGNDRREIAPLFAGAPENVALCANLNPVEASK